jgi:hypothetical protein
VDSTARREQIQRIIAEHDPYAALIGLFTREIALRTDGWEFGAAAYARAQQELIEGGFRTVDLFTTEDGPYEDEEEFLICALDTIQWTSVVIVRSGWETDETSTFLVFVAQRLGKPIYHYDTLEPLETDFTLSVGSDFDEDEDPPIPAISWAAETVEEAKAECHAHYNAIAREAVKHLNYVEALLELGREVCGVEMRDGAVQPIQTGVFETSGGIAAILPAGDPAPMPPVEPRPVWSWGLGSSSTGCLGRVESLVANDVVSASVAAPVDWSHLSDPTAPFPTTEDGTLNVLAEASRAVFSDRQATYGHPYDHHTITAGLLNALFRSKLKRKARFEAYDIWKILNCDKLARIQNGGYHVDGHTDIAGYAQVGVMVHERAEEEEAE